MPDPDLMTLTWKLRSGAERPAAALPSGLERVGTSSLDAAPTCDWAHCCEHANAARFATCLNSGAEFYYLHAVDAAAYVFHEECARCGAAPKAIAVSMPFETYATRLLQSLGALRASKSALAGYLWSVPRLAGMAHADAALEDDWLVPGPCVVCGGPYKSHCGGCLLATYCSPACVRADASTHREWCSGTTPPRTPRDLAATHLLKSSVTKSTSFADGMLIAALITVSTQTLPQLTPLFARFLGPGPYRDPILAVFVSYKLAFPKGVLKRYKGHDQIKKLMEFAAE